MKGQNTIATVVLVFVLGIMLLPSAQLIYAAGNGGWSSLNAVEKFLVVLIVPSLALGLVLVPFRRNDDINQR